MELQEKKAADLSAEELKLLLGERNKKELELQQRDRAAFESILDENAKGIVMDAIEHRKKLEEFYHKTIERLDNMKVMLDEYGKIRSNSKGGFHIKSRDNKFKVVYRFQSICDWDSRAVKAEELLKEFLKDVLMPRDADSYAIIMAMLEKNKEGKLEYGRLQALYSQENRFDDARWLEAIRLFKESFVATNSKMGLEFYRRADVSLKWEPINLNLSSF